jgi:hypothetical protein
MITKWLSLPLAGGTLDQIETNLLDEFAPDLRRMENIKTVTRPPQSAKENGARSATCSKMLNLSALRLLCGRENPMPEFLAH